MGTGSKTGGVRCTIRAPIEATFARSFREAQTYLSVLTLAPMLPGVLLTVMPLDQAAWTMWVPEWPCVAP